MREALLSETMDAEVAAQADGIALLSCTCADRTPWSGLERDPGPRTAKARVEPAQELSVGLWRSDEPLPLQEL